MQAFIKQNTQGLREWLRSVGLQPIDYPECDERDGLIAPYGRDNLFYGMVKRECPSLIGVG